MGHKEDRVRAASNHRYNGDLLVPTQVWGSIRKSPCENPCEPSGLCVTCTIAKQAERQGGDFGTHRTSPRSSFSQGLLDPAVVLQPSSCVFQEGHLPPVRWGKMPKSQGTQLQNTHLVPAGHQDRPSRPLNAQAPAPFPARTLRTKPSSLTPPACASRTWPCREGGATSGCTLLFRAGRVPRAQRKSQDADPASS